jgi:hypothetical protein
MAGIELAGVGVELTDGGTTANIIVGTSTITSGTNGRVLYDNNGVVGEKAVTGTGNAVLATGPTLSAPIVDVMKLTATIIASLPTPVAGMVAYVTDGDPALAWGDIAVNSGGGTTKYMVWYNGTNWTVAGK